MHPVALNIISAYERVFSIGITLNPANFACNALMGSTSVTVTFAPKPLALIAIPEEQWPYPAITTFFPANSTCIPYIAAIIPWPVPNSLSNWFLHLASFTGKSGTFKTPFLSIALNLLTPVVVSSWHAIITPELISSWYSWWALTIISAPSSIKMFGLASKHCLIHQ